MMIGDDLTNKWSNGGREHRTALHNEGHSRSNDNGNVTCDPTKWKREICKHKQIPQHPWARHSSCILIECCCWPVLRICLTTVATCPFSMELSSLTMRTRQEQSTSRDTASRITPTARSDRFTSAKRCWPTYAAKTRPQLDIAKKNSDSVYRQHLFL